MRPSYALWLLGLSIAGSGCALVEDGSRNLFVAISTPIEVHREKARNEKWAEAAWQTAIMRDGPGTHTEDYARGFKDGFAEYLFRGGDGEPPLVAPLRYRQIRYQNPQGYQAIQDWFAGYRHGAAAARDSGARKWITSPSGLQTELPEAPTHEVPFVVPNELPPEHNEVIPLPLPQELPKKTFTPAFLGPAKVGLEAPRSEAPPTVAEPMAKKQPQTPKAKITEVRAAPSAVPEPPRLRITGVSEAPGVAPAPVVEEPPIPDSVRVRIKAITAVPPKD
jgi:hypothetical protein